MLYPSRFYVPDHLATKKLANDNGYAWTDVDRIAQAYALIEALKSTWDEMSENERNHVLTRLNLTIK